MQTTVEITIITNQLTLGLPINQNFFHFHLYLSKVCLSEKAVPTCLKNIFSDYLFTLGQNEGIQELFDIN